MNNLNKGLFLTVALLCGIFFLANCGGSTTTTTTNNTTTANKPADTTKPADTAKPDAAKPETASTDKIGVAECDEYMDKWEACVNGKVPEAQRAMFKSSFETTRKSWKDLAANPQTKASLTNACKQATEQAKQSFAAYKCEW